MAKQTQTDYTRGGKAISDTAIPYYQNTLTTMNDYIQNPYGTVDTIMDKYYSNNAMQQDFLRNYNRAMANTSAGNYSATGGGYSSAGQRAYNDAQRYQNDLASRLQQYGVGQAFAGQNQLFGQALSGSQAFNQAYGLGKDYSDIEQYNYLADQNNSFGNQLAGIGGQVLQGVGGALTFVNPALGAGVSALGNIASSQTIDPSSALGGSSAGQSAGNTGWGQSIGQNAGIGFALNKAQGLDWLGRPIVNKGTDSQGNKTVQVGNAPAIRGY